MVVYSEAKKIKCQRERLQLAMFLLLLSFTAARPGELICSKWHAPDNDGLKYGDLTFNIDKLPDGQTAIVVDVLIRNLKGHRTDECYRIQGIYQDFEHLPPLFDPSLLLTSLALMDDVFEHVTTIEEILSIDPGDIEKMIDSIKRARTTLFRGSFCSQIYVDTS